MHNSAASQDKSSKGPGADNRAIKKLANPGIKVGGRAINLSRPVKVNGELRLKGGKTGAKLKGYNRKLSQIRNLNHIPEEPDPEAQTSQ